MILEAAPNFERAGVVAGFVLGFTNYPFPVVTLTKGVLFAQGAMFRPATIGEILATLTPPVLGGMKWLYYNSVSGFYWQGEPCPTVADDAFVGWALTDSAGIVAVSHQLVEVPDPTGPAPRVVTLGPVMPAEPEGGAHGDTAVPDPVMCQWRSVKPGHVDLWGLQPTGNGHSIRTVTLGLAYRDQTAAGPGTLTADVDADDTVFPVGDGTQFQVGWLYLIDREFVYVDSIDGNNVTVQRGVHSTIAAAHFGPKAITGATNATPIVVSCAGHGREADDAVSISGVGGNTAANGGWLAGSPAAGSFALTGSSGNAAYSSGGTLAGSRLYEVLWNVSVFTFEPEFFDGESAADWSASIALPSALICAISSVAVNAFGEGESWVGNKLSSGWWPTGFGGQILLTAEGVLGIESDLVPPVTVAQGMAVAGVSAGVKTPPSGGKVVAVVKADGAAWATLTIADGDWEAVALDGRALAPLPAGIVLTMDVTGVGATFPGERLVVEVRL